MLQRTLQKPARALEGPGVHSGRRTRILCKPAPPDSGLRFYTPERGPERAIQATLEFVAGDHSLRRTILQHPDGWTLETPEHLLSACTGLGITNLDVEVDGPGELPILDGSAAPYVQALLDAGLHDQPDTTALRWTVAEPVFFRHDNAELAALPSNTGDHLTLACFLDFPATAIGRQGLVLAIHPDTYPDEVAPARTFALEADLEALRARGLIQGGTLDIAVVAASDRYLNPSLRFPDECARHKILDLLGDLVLVGGLPRGHFMAYRAGHLSHLAFAHFLRKEHRIRWIPPSPVSPSP